MKKLFLVLGILAGITSSMTAFGACEYTCVEPYDTNGKFMSFLSTITGANFISEKVAQNILKKEIEKNVTGKDLKVKVESYSAKDLKNGIFKSIEVNGNNVVANGIYLSTVDVKTLCDFNYIQQKGGNVVFKQDFPMSVKLTISADDINNTMNTDKYKKIINDVNRLGFGGVKVSSTKAVITSNKFSYVIGISIPFIKAEKYLYINADLNVKDGKIDFENTRLSSKSFNLDLKKVDFIINYLNPLDFSMNILDNKSAKVSVSNIYIENNIINVSGIVVIPKD